MHRSFTLALLILVSAAPSAAQSVRTKLYSKVQGDDVLAAIQFRPDPGCWIYDDDDPGDFAKPTIVTLGALEGATWSEVRFPEPYAKEGPLGVNNVFKEKTIAYAVARGAAAAGLAAEGVTANVDGQVCNEGLCVDVNEDLTSTGEGTDAVWEGFPADLLEAPAEAEGDAGAEAGDWPPVLEGAAPAARYFARVNEYDEIEVVVELAVPEHFHLYAGPTAEDMGPTVGIPTTFEFSGGAVEFDPVHYPRPEAYVTPAIDGDGETYAWTYEGGPLFGAVGFSDEEVDLEALEVKVSGQSCDDSGCTPFGVVASYAGEGDDDLYAAAFAEWEMPEPPALARGADAAASQDGSGGDGGTATFGQETESSSFGAFIWLAILAGFVTLLMPCTYPMIPITISYFTKQAEVRDGKVAGLAVIYGLGIVVTFVLSGVAFGSVISPFANHWITNLFIGLVFVAFAMSLFGMFELRPPKFLMNIAGGANAKGGYGGVFLMGLTLVVTSFTCTGPFVGSLIAGGSGYATWQIGVGMAAFGATMATPFVALAMLPGRASSMPSAGAWMNTLKVFMGFVELAAALKFLSNADIAQGWMLLPREVFLALWFLILGVAGVFLLGMINLKGESPDGNIGPGRLLGALATLSFALYCGLGALGYELDGKVMSALAPPPDYSRGLVPTHAPLSLEDLEGLSMGSGQPLPEGVERTAGGLITIDDYDLARSVAIERDLGLLINFTAHT